MELQVSLAPSGGIRVRCPSGRTLDLGEGEAGYRFLCKMLRDASAGVRDERGYIGEFPTQHVINTWLRQDAAARKAEAAERAKTEAAMKGIDLNALTISL